MYTQTKNIKDQIENATVTIEILSYCQLLCIGQTETNVRLDINIIVWDSDQSRLI